MYYHLLPLPFSLIVIILYTIARTKLDMKKTQILQPTMTSLALLIGLLSLFHPNANTGFSLWIIGGLAFSLAADLVHIDMRKDNILMIGILMFTVAYLIYPIGMTVYNGFHEQDLYVGIVLFIIYIASIAYLWPGLGTFKIPAMIYGLVCPFMVSRAISTFFGDAFTMTQSIMLVAGTALLYIGDLEYAVHRFRKPLPFLSGHICYGVGQVLMALSPSYFSGA